MTGLVKISKHGEPDLEIHESALAQHRKLGWRLASEKEHATDQRLVIVHAEAHELARENGLDVTRMTGTGNDGAITMGDVEAAIEAKQSANAAQGGETDAAGTAEQKPKKNGKKGKSEAEQGANAAQ